MSYWQDLRYAARNLTKSPGFTITATLTMALGIGITTSIFSVCDAMLWKPVPLPHLESLVVILQRVSENPNWWESTTPADTADLQRGNSSLEKFASWQGGLANLAGSGEEPERVNQALVTPSFFDTLQVQPARGRAFQHGEDRPGQNHQVILGDRLWRRRFGADPKIVGQTIRLDDEPYTVVGIMPDNFEFPLAAELWTPLALTPEQASSRRAKSLQTIARLKPGRTVQQAESELNAVAATLEKTFPETNKNRQFLAWPATKFLVEFETKQYLQMLLGSVLFVLLIACANVANLQFARANGRTREVAVRRALGASRARIISQLITESILLSTIGAILGLLVAKWGITLIRAGMPAEVERYVMGFRNIQLDARALMFTLAAALVSGILAGLTPAWQTSQPDLTGSLKEGGRGNSSGKSRRRLGNALVAAEVALAVVLLVGAGLMVRGFSSMVQSGESLEPSTLLTLRLAITSQKYHEKHQVAEFYRQVLDRIKTLPGVRSAVAVTALPFADHSSSRLFRIEGRQIEPGNQPAAMYQVASPEYFDTLHVPLREGRFLRPGDNANAPPVVVISERLAQRWWNGESPIGKRIGIGENGPWLTIVGIAGNMIHNPYDRLPRRAMYLPYQQAPELWMDIGVRTTGDPLLLAPAVTAAIRSIDPEQPVTDMHTMARSIHNRAIGLNYVAALMGIFGAVALFLSAIGVYGVMAYVVAQQTHDIGIRMALGASRGSVFQMLLLRGMTVTGIGLALGLPVAYALARLMSSLIIGVSTGDAVTFAGIPLTLAVAAALANYIPARRAMQIDPLVALRYE